MSETELIRADASAIAGTEVPDAIALQPILPAGDAEEAPPSTTESQQDAEIEQVSYLKVCVTVLPTMLVLILASLDANIIATAVPSITDYFHTIADVGWYLTAYRLMAAGLQFAFGKAYTLFRTKPTFIFCNLIFLMGSVLCAAATTSPMFIAGRAFTGAGLAGLAAGFFKMIVDLIPLRQRPVFTAMFAVVETCAGMVAPTLGGVIVQNLSWRWCFWINLPIGGVAVILMIFFLPETSKDRPHLTWTEILRQLDLTGTLVFVPALAALFIALNWGGIVYSWSNPKVIACFAVFGFLLIIFAVDQVVKGDNAILPLRVLKDRNVYAGALYSVCLASSLSITEYYAPTFFQAVLGYSPARSGYMMFPCLVGTTLAFVVQGPGTTYLGYLNPFMIASSILMPIAAGLLTTWSPSTDLPKLVCTFGLFGFSNGLGYMAPQQSVQTSLANKDVQLGLAVILFCRNFGPALFVAIAQAIFTNRLSANLHQLAPNSNATRIEALGLTEIKGQFSPEKLHHVTLAFSDSITQTWYLVLGLCCVSIIGAALTKWISVKKKED